MPRANGPSPAFGSTHMLRSDWRSEARRDIVVTSAVGQDDAVKHDGANGCVKCSRVGVRILLGNGGMRLAATLTFLLGFSPLGFLISTPADAETFAARLSTGLPLKPGSYELILDGSHDHSYGATFRGKLGGIAFSGISVQPHRHAAVYVITGAWGRDKFRLPVVMSVGVLHPGGVLLVVKVSGTLGGQAVHGSLEIHGEIVTFTGTAGTTKVTMRAPISAAGSTHERARVKIG